MIKLTNLDRLYNDLKPQLQQAQEQVLQSGSVMLGTFTQQLEQAIAKHSGAKYCAVVGSGSDALMYGLRASGVHTVSMPAQSYIATPNSASRADITIDWVDVDNKGCIDWNACTGTHAVWVGLFGNDTQFAPGLKVFEDGAQHFGLPLKGEFASYSFDPTKSLPNFGNGGAVVSNNEQLIDSVRRLRRHGQFTHHVGGNSVMSERDCAELLVKLPKFDEWTSRRRKIANMYIGEIGDMVDYVTDPNGMVSKFVIDTEHKSALSAYLTEHNIQTKNAYAQPLIEKPQAQNNCERFLQLPCDSYTSDKEASYIVETVKMFFKPSPLKT